MTFQPVIPLSGVAGWAFLNRTLDVQKQSFAQSAPSVREEDYFKANIQSVLTAEGLVSDRRLLSVALGAFGLDEDLPNKAFIQKVLEDGTSDPAALANRLSDKRYKAFSDAFGFGAGQIRGNLASGFADEILERHRTTQFEQAVGNLDGDLRIALNLRRELTEISESSMSENAKLYTILGNPPLRTAFETAFGLPSAFSALDLDRQVTTFKEKIGASFPDNTVSQFRDPELAEDLIRRFLVRSELNSFQASATPAATALQLLQY